MNDWHRPLSNVFSMADDVLLQMKCQCGIFLFIAAGVLVNSS